MQKKQKTGRKKLPYGEKLHTICVQLRGDQREQISKIERDPTYGSGYAALIRQVVDAGLKALRPAD